MLRGYKTFDLWSDGGPHHFKNKNAIYMWYRLMKEFGVCHLLLVKLTHQQVNFRVNMFAPYHGWNHCDTAASQFKFHCNEIQLNRDMVIDTPYLFPAAVDDLEGHSAHVLQHIQRGNKALVEGLDGIRSTYFCFRFEGDICQAYKRSHDPKPHQRYQVEVVNHHTRRGCRGPTVHFILIK